MAVSKRLRYEVLRRDNHACHYCGAKAPDVKLTVDHVVPVALGGTDDPTNLVAACDTCNGGKTSSNPDAPVVAQVADDAIRWAQAMKHAQASALADLNAREANRRQFAEWWDAWSYEYRGQRRDIPRPGGWEQTVDALVAAGLPMRLLEECIDLAMTRTRVVNDEKFRYMCGVAWKRLTELQESARALTAPLDSSEEDEHAPGRADLACELLGDLASDDRDRILAETKEAISPVSEDELHIGAAHWAWQEARTGLAWLLFSVCDLLPMIPDPVIRDALLQARVKLYDERGPEFSREDWANRAMSIAAARYTAADVLNENGAPF